MGGAREAEIDEAQHNVEFTIHRGSIATIPIYSRILSHPSVPLPTITDDMTFVCFAEQGPDKVYFSCPSCMPTVGGGGTEARDKRTADEAVSNKMCNTCEQAIKQEGAELSGTFRMIPVPSTPPPSPICLHRGRFLNCQDSGTGSVISFAEQAAFLPSVSGGSSPPGSPGRAGAKRSPPGEVERRSSSRSPAYFPGRNSTAGVQDYGVDRRGMPPLDFIAYLHQAFPGRPFSCMQGAFSKGAPCLLPQCCCLAHLLLRLQNEDEAAARRQDGNPPAPLPPDGDARQDPAVKDGPARTSSAPVARTRTANGPQKSPAGSPRQEASKGEVLKGVNRRNPQCPGQVRAPPPPPFFPSFTYPQGPPAAAQHGVDFHDFNYDLRNYCITPHVPCIADAETQWSEQASQVGTEDEPDWSMVVEVSRKSDPVLCARCSSDLPGEFSNQESTFSSWGTSRTEPATLSKNSSEVFALYASSACPGREASTVSALLYLDRVRSAVALIVSESRVFCCCNFLSSPHPPPFFFLFLFFFFFFFFDATRKFNR